MPPNILLSRPVDQAGRKSKTTLGIAGLHFEIGAFLCCGVTPSVSTQITFSIPAFKRLEQVE